MYEEIHLILAYDKFIVTFPLDIYQNSDIIYLLMRGRAEAARRAHNPEVIGSNPIPATFFVCFTSKRIGKQAFFCQKWRMEILNL